MTHVANVNEKLIQITPGINQSSPSKCQMQVIRCFLNVPFFQFFCSVSVDDFTCSNAIVVGQGLIISSKKKASCSWFVFATGDIYSAYIMISLYVSSGFLDKTYVSEL